MAARQNFSASSSRDTLAIIRFGATIVPSAAAMDAVGEVADKRQRQGRGMRMPPPGELSCECTVRRVPFPGPVRGGNVSD